MVHDFLCPIYKIFSSLETAPLLLSTGADVSSCFLLCFTPVGSLSYWKQLICSPPFYCLPCSLSSLIVFLVLLLSLLQLYFLFSCFNCISCSPALFFYSLLVCTFASKIFLNSNNSTAVTYHFQCYFLQFFCLFQILKYILYVNY